MKKSFTLSFLLISSIFYSTKSFATHYRSADITFKIIGNNQIEATITTYSKFDGESQAIDRPMVTIFWGDGTRDSICRINGPFNGSTGCNDGVLISTNPVNIKKNEYTGTHTYAGLPSSGFFVISFFDMNRVDGIVNMDAGHSVDVPLYVEATVFFRTDFSNIGLNSSPVFTVPPIDFANLNDTFTFNPVVVDADGDSISIEMTNPLQSHGMTVPVYSSPDLYCQAQGQMNSFLQVNQQTGHIRWAPPCRMGIYNIALLVSEYRCGVLLSTVMRDMQIITLGENNDPPFISPISDYFIQPGGSISFNVSASDPNISQTVSLAAYGGAFLDSINQPVFQTTSGNPASGTFTWQPGISSAKKHAYIFSIVAKDNYQTLGNPINLEAYQTFRVWVEDTSACLFSGVDDLNQGGLTNISPNPFTSFINITTEKPFEFTICDYTGRVVLSGVSDKTIATEALASGGYILSIKNEEMFSVRKVVKY